MLLRKLLSILFAPLIASFKANPVATIASVATIMADFHEKAGQLTNLIDSHKGIADEHSAVIEKATADRQVSLDEIELAKRTQAAFAKFLDIKVA